MAAAGCLAHLDLRGGLLLANWPFPPASPLQEGSCALGDSCPYAHSVFEYW